MDACNVLIGLATGLVSGVVASALVAVLLELILRPNLEINVNLGDIQGQAAGKHLVHVSVANIPAWLPGRRPAWSTQAHLSVVKSDGTDTLVGPIPARWISQPEPIVTMETGQPRLDVPRIIAGRKVDIHTHEPQALVIAMKFENDVYLFTNESYAYPNWANPNWKLSESRNRIRITVDYERGRETRDFWLRHDKVSLEAVS